MHEYYGRVDTTNDQAEGLQRLRREAVDPTTAAD